MIEIDFKQRTIRGTCRAGDIKAKGLFKASMESDMPIDIQVQNEMD